MKYKLWVILSIMTLMILCATPVFAAETAYNPNTNGNASMLLRAYTASYDVNNGVWVANTPITADMYLTAGDCVVLDIYGSGVSGAYFINAWININGMNIEPVDNIELNPITTGIFTRDISGTGHLATSYLNILNMSNGGGIGKNNLDAGILKLEGGPIPATTVLTKSSGIIGSVLMKVKSNGTFTINSVNQLSDDNVIYRPYLSWFINSQEDRHTIPITPVTLNVGTPPVKVTGVTIDKPNVSLKVGGSNQSVVATVYPLDATDKTVTWSSSDTNVVTVTYGTGASSVNAVLTPKGKGDATVTVTTVDGSKTATCTVKVVQPVASVSLNPNNLEITVGGTDKTVTAILSPPDASNQDFIWTSNAENFATVTKGANGTAIVKAVSEGNAVITVTTVDDGRTSSCNVTVHPAVAHVTGVSLLPAGPTITKAVREGSVKFTAIVTPEEANKAVEWDSSDSTVASIVDNKDGTATVTLLKAGTTDITVTTVDRNASTGEKLTASCTIIVPESVTDVTIVSTKTMNDGDTDTLTASVLPINAANKAVTWESSDSSVVEISYTPGVGSNTAQLTAKKKGTATITVTTVDGSIAKTCIVTVGEPVTGVSLDNRTLSMLLDNNKRTLTATIVPPDADNQNLIWSIAGDSVVDLAYSDDNKVVTITPKALGTVTVTVTTEDGTSTDSCVITVSPVKVTGISLTPPTDNLYFGGPTYQLSHTIYPDNATDKSVIWSSYREDIATVSENGEVTPKDKGTSKITVSAGVYSSTCDVKVISPIEVVPGSFSITNYDGTPITQFAGDTFYYINVKLHDLIDKNFTPLTIIQVNEVKDNKIGKVVEFDSLKSTVRYTKDSTDGNIELSAGFRLPAGSGSYQAQLYVWSNWLSVPGERHLVYNEPDDNNFPIVVSN